MVMPSLAALSALEPAPSPITTRSVLAETDPVAIPPSRSTASWASVRLRPGTVPVTTTFLPARGRDVDEAEVAGTADLVCTPTATRRQLIGFALVLQPIKLPLAKLPHGLANPPGGSHE